MSHSRQRLVFSVVAAGLAVLGAFALLWLTGGRAAAQTNAGDLPAAPTLPTDRAAAAQVGAAAAHNVPPAGDLQLPAGARAMRIEVDATGIYEITFAQMQAAGMQPATLNPATLQMMSRGYPVSYQFLGDNDAIFEQGERIRFFGWGIESRYERLYVDKNVYWLWGGGTPTRIATEANDVSYQPALSWSSTITFEHDLFFTPTYARWLAGFDNPPDAWFWDYLDYGIEYTYPLTLPNPAESGPPAQYVVELFSRNQYSNSAVVRLANDDTPAVSSWAGRRSVNLRGELAHFLVDNGVNQLTILTGAIGNSDRHFNFNRVTVTYQRRLIAIDSELLVNFTQPGDWTFRVGGLPANAGVVVWDVSDRFHPRAVSVSNSNAAGQVRVGRSVEADAALKLYVAAETSVRQPLRLTRYDVPTTSPASGRAEWLAVTHTTLMTETQRLADYRATTDGLAAHVVDSAEVTAIYGHGLETPAAIQRLAQRAYAEWGLQYLLLVGDATQNPLQKPCVIEAPACLQRWNESLGALSLVTTDLVFEDRFLGLVPSDHTFTLLAGDDVVPEIAVGRLAARTAAEARAMVNKTMRYDSAVRAEEAWLKRILFLADNADAGGDFCRENRDIYTETLPEPYASAVAEQCLDDYLAAGKTTTDFRNDFFNHVANISGAGATNPGIVNYRGHGGIDDWASGIIRSGVHSELWANFNHPVVILSADCLDGHFAWLGVDGLSETFFRLPPRNGQMVGSAAHWGSSGLGYSFEHTALHREFYNALYRDNALTIGRAINSSKTHYIENNSGSLSEIYTMTLHGDPALRMPLPPAERGLTATADTTVAQAAAGESAVYTLTITNTGNRAETFMVAANSVWPTTLSATSVPNVQPGAAAMVTLRHSVPAGTTRLTMHSATVTVRSAADTSVAQSVVFTTQAGLPVELFVPILPREVGRGR